jgi:hypothetical protein
MGDAHDNLNRVPSSFAPVVEEYSASVFKVETKDGFGTVEVVSAFLVKRRGRCFLATNKWPVWNSAAPIKVSSSTNAQVIWTKIHYCGIENIALIELAGLNNIEDINAFPVLARLLPFGGVVTLEYGPENLFAEPALRSRFGLLTPFTIRRDESNHQILISISSDWMTVGGPVLQP